MLQSYIFNKIYTTSGDIKTKATASKFDNLALAEQILTLIVFL